MKQNNSYVLTLLNILYCNLEVVSRVPIRQIFSLDAKEYMWNQFCDEAISFDPTFKEKKKKTGC